MDLLKGNIKGTYLKYLGAAFGSAMISSIYGIVDMAMVGQYQGPMGTAALAVVAPVWNIIYSLGLLTGIGGSVLLAQAKGQQNVKEQNQYFSTAVILTFLLAVVCWVIVAIFDTQMLRVFGAEELLLPFAKQYLEPIKFVVPVFLFNQMLAAFLRNDNAPGLATAAVLVGGIFNVVGDYFFVFTLDMGIKGAGLATAIGAVITLVVMCSHFISKMNTLKMQIPKNIGSKLKKIVGIGLATFVIDVSMGVLTIFFNRQIIGYINTDALAVYGVLVNISTIVQCCAYSVGQAGQPLLSTNYGAGNWDRIKGTLKYMVFTAGVFGILWTVCICLFPNDFIRIFMNATEEIFSIAPSIMRVYGISFLILPFNVFSTYYFQSVMKPNISLMIATARGIIVCGILVYLLPAVWGGEAIWFTMPITELLISIFVLIAMKSVARRIVQTPQTEASR